MGKTDYFLSPMDVEEILWHLNHCPNLHGDHCITNEYVKRMAAELAVYRRAQDAVLTCW